MVLYGTLDKEEKRVQVRSNLGRPERKDPSEVLDLTRDAAQTAKNRITLCVTVNLAASNAFRQTPFTLGVEIWQSAKLLVGGPPPPTTTTVTDVCI